MDAITPRSAGVTQVEATGISPVTLRDAGSLAVVGLFVLAMFATLYAARSVFVPLVLSWAIGTALIPAVEGLRRWGVPRTLASIGAALAFIATVLSFLALLTVPIGFWIGRASELGVLIKQKVALLSQPFSFLEEISTAIREATGTSADNGAASIDPTATLAQTTAAYISPLLTQGLLFVGGLVFFLIYREQLKKNLVLIAWDRRTRLTILKILTEIEDSMSRYFSTVTLVNLGLGIATGVIAWFAGLPNPVLWGALTAILNFIPYIGPALTALILAAAGLFVFPTIAAALVAPSAFVIVSLIESEIVTPSILGKRMSINPFLVFVAIGFWSWLWGPVGAFLAVPLLMSAAVVWDHFAARETIELPG